MMPSHRLWAEIDLDAIAANFRAVRDHVGPAVRILAVVKADAYGHGAAAVARCLEEEGAEGFGVGDAAEALELREEGIRSPILILGAIVPGEVRAVVAADVSVSLFSHAMARHLHREARAQGKRVPVHLKVDTGMGRLGLAPDKILHIAESASLLKGLHLSGIFTHCPANDPELVSIQLHAFRNLLDALADRGVDIGTRHMANSSVLYHHPSTHFDMVRPGLCLYGVDPGDLRRVGAVLQPALTLRTPIVFLKEVPAGTYIGYRPGYKTYRATKIATLPVGYADGYSTLTSGRARVLLRGCEAVVAGRVSMDYTTVDVGHIPGVREGDIVTLIGRDGDLEVSAQDLARIMNTIPYEVVTMLASKRVVRKFKRAGKA
ncbi:MAG: alanine racemase [Planctomycetota bacterium]|jgi:alanine racemase